MTTLSNVLQDLFRDMGLAQTRKITATGTTTTSIDTTLGSDGVDEGTIIVVTDAAGAAPEGEFGRITAFASGTSTITHDALTVATAAGDYILMCRNDITLFDAIEVVNTALRKLGHLTFVDTTTLDTAANQTEYAAAVAWKYSQPSRIDIQGITTDTNDNRWRTTRGWYYVPATANSTGLIVFTEQPVSPRDIRIWYRGTHARVAAYNSYIDERIHPELIRKAALYEALNTLVANYGTGADRDLVERRNLAESEYRNARSEYPIWSQKRLHKYTSIDTADDYNFVPGTVRL